MSFRRIVLTVGLVFSVTFAVFAEPASSKKNPTGVPSTYSGQFLNRNGEFRFGVQRTEENSAACTGAYAAAEFKPANLDFGTVEIGDDKTLSFTITNNDPETNLEIRKIVSLNARFEVTDAPNLPACLSPRQSTTVDVTFSPTHELELVSQIRVTHTGTDGNEVFTRVLVSGRGEEGNGGGGGITVSPSSLSFGQVGVGENLSKSFTIRNGGNSSQTIDEIRSSNPAFTVVSPAFPRNLNAGQSANVSVRFLPNRTGSFSGRLSVINGSGQVAAEVTASGSGVAVGNPDIAISPAQLDYGQIESGTFKDLNLTISNSGNAVLTIQSFRFSDPAFEISPGTPAQIEKGKNKVFKVRFLSSVKGAQTKTLTILSNDPDEASVQVSMLGNVVGGKIGFSDKSISSRLRGNPIRTVGLQWVDFNKDERVDLYITGTNGNVICTNAGQSKFTNGTGPAKLGNNGAVGQGASWADVDNDGDLDVFIANENSPSVVLKNNNGVFSQVQNLLGKSFLSETATQAEGGVWLDFNRDGKLDLYIVQSGAPNQLLKNNGVFNLVNVAASARVDLNSAGRSAVVSDFNNDGFADIYVVNFNRPNKLYINNQNETFRDVTTSAGVGFTGASQQAVVSDYDQDGDSDLFVVSSGRSSILYRNQGNLKFQNATGVSGLAGPKNGRSASFADYDNDGDDDLLILQAPGGNILFRNNGAGKFARVGNVDLDESDDPTSVVNGDFNNDGLIDVVVGDGDGGQQNGDSIFVNSGGDGNNFLILTLEGTQSNRSAIGAKVLVRVGLIPQAKEVSAGNGKNQESLPLEFGLGSATSATSVQIFWPSGRQQDLSNVVAGRLKVVEPSN